MQAFVIINSVGMMTNFDKGVCDRWYICDLSNCECKCDQSCDACEYLDYKNCKCSKKLVDKLLEECTETAEKVKIVNENKNECS